MSLVIKGTDLQDALRNVFIYEVESYKILQMNETVPTHLFTFCPKAKECDPYHGFLPYSRPTFDIVVM